MTSSSSSPLPRSAPHLFPNRGQEDARKTGALSRKLSKAAMENKDVTPAGAAKEPLAGRPVQRRAHESEVSGCDHPERVAQPERLRQLAAQPAEHVREIRVHARQLAQPAVRRTSTED